jgi:hypothetical protein
MHGKSIILLALFASLLLATSPSAMIGEAGQNDVVEQPNRPAPVNELDSERGAVLAAATRKKEQAPPARSLLCSEPFEPCSFGDHPEGIKSGD